MTKYLIAVLFLAVPAVACKQGETLYEGECAANLTPIETVRTPDAQPSDEKPPTDKMPSYQREGIHVDEAKPGVEESTSVAHDYESERNQK